MGSLLSLLDEEEEEEDEEEDMMFDEFDCERMRLIT